MTAIPWGAVVLAAIVALAVRPLRRPPALAKLSWIVTCGLIEVPFVFLYLVIGATLPGLLDGELATAPGQVAAAIALLSIAGLVVVIGRARRSGPVLAAALRDGLGARWRSQVDPQLESRLRRRLPWLRIVTIPWVFGRRNVERIADVAYGDRGRNNLLDVYRHRSRSGAAPTLLYLHGGGFRSGAKNREARPLLYHLAGNGWTCLSANYYLSDTPAEGFPHHVIDVKRAIAWARDEGRSYGVDPETIIVVGASAGAHLAAMAALTANDPSFQPGFETADTAITAAVGLYGYYGQLGGADAAMTGPSAHVHADAPPFFVIHGDQDTFTPIEGARAFVEALRAVSARPVLFAELPGAQHSFDVFSSIRFEHVVDAIEAFAAWARGAPGRPPGMSQ